MKHMLTGLLRCAMVMTALCWCCIPPSTLAATDPDTDQAPGRKMAQQATKEKKLWITADHSKHKALQQEFTSGPEVTKACLSCHTEAAQQVHQTVHWTWRDLSSEGNSDFDKGGLSINNF